jgi:4-carboxymuconolactone decarboxylase
MSHKYVCLFVLIASLTAPVLAQERLPLPAPDKMTPEQKKAAQLFIQERGEDVTHFGPFVPILRSPEVAMRGRALGDYLRFHSAVPSKLREFTIMLSARLFSQQYEWNFHYPIALKEGVSTSVLEAVRIGARPAGMSSDLETVYEFLDELHRNRSVSDPTYDKTLNLLGDKGLIDLICLDGYFMMIGEIANVDRAPLQKDSKATILPRIPDNR